MHFLLLKKADVEVWTCWLGWSSRIGLMRYCEYYSLSGRSNLKIPSSHLKSEALTDFSDKSLRIACLKRMIKCFFRLCSPVLKFKMWRCFLTQASHPHWVLSPASVALIWRTPVIQVLQVIHNLQNKCTWSSIQHSSDSSEFMSCSGLFFFFFSENTI